VLCAEQLAVVFVVLEAERAATWLRAAETIRMPHGVTGQHRGGPGSRQAATSAGRAEALVATSTTEQLLTVTGLLRGRGRGEGDELLPVRPEQRATTAGALVVAHTRSAPPKQRSDVSSKLHFKLLPGFSVRWLLLKVDYTCT